MITEDTASEGRDTPEPPEPPPPPEQPEQPPGPAPPPPVAEGPPPPAGPPPGGKGRGWWVAVAAALVVVALVAGAVGVVLGRNDQERLRQAPLPQAGSQLDVGGVQLASLLASAKDQTFHARYTSTVDPQVSGGRLELEWWNTKDKTRIDTVLTQPDKVVRTASISAGKTSVTCQRIADEPWTCTAVDRPPTADPTGLVASLTAQLSGRPVTESTDTVAGHEARCFHVGAPGDPLDVCANPEGVMLRVVSEQARYEIASLDADIPESIFDPPAKP